MKRVVLDANILVSGIAFSTGLQARIVDRRVAGEFILIVSAHLVEEVSRALDRSDFASRTEGGYVIELAAALERAVRVVVDDIATSIASHPEDDVILATAVLGKADVLVTGDKQLLKLGRVEGVRIVDSRTFLEMLDDED